MDYILVGCFQVAASIPLETEITTVKLREIDDREGYKRK